MPTNTMTSKVWKNHRTSQYYLVPEDFVFIPGADEIIDLEGERRFANLALIQHFEKPAEEVQAFLKNKLKDSILAAKQTFIALRNLSESAKGEDFAKSGESPELMLKNLISSAFSGYFPQVANLEATVFNALEQLKNDPSQMPKELLSLFPEEEHESVFKTAMIHLRSLAEKIDNSLTTEKDNPETWVKVLYQKLFQDEIEQKEKARKKRLEKTVDDSIAEGLRKRGITPSADFDKT